MKTKLLIFLLSICYAAATAQVPVKDSLIIKDTTAVTLQDSLRFKSNDTISTNYPRNIYGGLLNDDPVYNRKYAWWIPAVRVGMADAFNWSINKYLFHYEWADISASTWKYNLKHGWEWDNDHFGTNFIGHPYNGNIYFNIARSNGYSFWESLPFAIEGSLIWEYFGENTRPSRNDMINTPFSGILLGEMVYRISSKILDDRATGANRVWREILAGIINPPRALNRLTQGKTFRVSTKETLQKEPLTTTISAGLHKINDNNKFGTGSTNFVVNMRFDYGDPFEIRHRKPFDVFRLGTESSFGLRKKLLGNVLGSGLLFGKSLSIDNNELLIGGFQYFDYWNNKIFELGSLGFGGGALSKIPLSRNSSLFSSLHIAAVPMAGNNTGFGPDTSKYRDYNFGGGLETKIDETLHMTKFADIGFSGYYYWIHNYENLPGKSIIGILKPRITLNFSKIFSLGLEHQIFYVNRYLDKTPTLHLRRTEQKFFFQISLDDRGRQTRN